MDKVAIIIPCFNEEKTILKVITDWKLALPEAVIYVYDNNSTDATVQIAEEAGAIVRHENLQGKGNVVRRMFLEVDAYCYIMVDGDDTYSAATGSEMVSAVLDNGADMVIGDRLSSTYFDENKRRFHNSGNSLIRSIINRFFKSDVKDILTGYRAFSYRFAKSFPVVTKGFEIETEMTIHAIDKNMQLENILVEYRDRPEGSESKLNTISDGIKIMGTILHLYCNYRPLRFFGWISLLLLILAAIFSIPVFVEFINTGLVLRFPTLIVSGFCVIAALLSFFAGLILMVIQHKERREFEFRLQTIEYWKKQLEER